MLYERVHPDRCQLGLIAKQDAAAAALFTACKIEDTLKKSREILCAAWNLKLAVSEQLSPDDPVSTTTSLNPSSQSERLHLITVV